MGLSHSSWGCSSGKHIAKCDISAPISEEMTAQIPQSLQTPPWMSLQKPHQPKMSQPVAYGQLLASWKDWYKTCWMGQTPRWVSSVVRAHCCTCPLAKVTELVTSSQLILKSLVSEKASVAYRDGLSWCTTGFVSQLVSQEPNQYMGFQLALLRPHEFQGYTLKQLSVWEMFWKIN